MYYESRIATEEKDKTKKYNQQADKRKGKQKTCSTKTKESKKQTNKKTKTEMKNKLGKVLNSIMVEIYPSLGITTLNINGPL